MEISTEPKAGDWACETLVRHLTENHMRRTPERFAVLEAARRLGPSSLREIGEWLEDSGFRVSRATIYNAVNLFLRLRIIEKRVENGATIYELVDRQHNHGFKVCNVCGRKWEVDSPELAEALEQVKVKGFKKEAASMYVYGVCASCRAKRRKAARLRTEKTTKTK